MTFFIWGHGCMDLESLAVWGKFVRRICWREGNVNLALKNHLWCIINCSVHWLLGIDVTNVSGIQRTNKAKVLGPFGNGEYLTKMHGALFKIICSGSEAKAQVKASF